MARGIGLIVDEVVSQLPVDGSKIEASALVKALLAENPQSVGAYQLPQLVKGGYINGELAQLDNGNYTAMFSRKVVAPVSPSIPKIASVSKTPVSAQ